MMRLLLIIIYSLCLFSQAYSHPVSQWPVEGDWVGEIQLKGDSLFIKAHFKSEGSGIKATADIPLQQKQGLELRNFRLSSSQLHFELLIDSEKLDFDGQLKEGVIAGELGWGGEHGTFKLIRLAAVAPNIFNRYAGTYQLQPGEIIFVGPGGGFTDFRSGSFRFLSPLSETTFFFGPSRDVSYPVIATITFVQNSNGEVTGLSLREGSSAARFAKRVDLFKEEEVSFRNGDVTLAGTLLLPTSTGSHAAIVCVHAGRDQTRRSFGPPPYFFAAHGFAVLIYDKRGSGASTGDWRESDFSDLAGDALAGVHLLKSRKDINPQRIGLWGISQGPWPAWLAASRSKEVAFVIAVSGPAVSPARQSLFVTENILRDSGVTGDELSAALSLQRLSDDVMRGIKPPEDLDAAIQKLKDKRWFPVVAPPPKGSWAWKWWLKVMDFDPVPVLEKVTQPVLAIYGGVDKLVRVEESVPILEKALKRGGNRDYTIKVFPNGNHDIYEATPETSKQYARLKGFAPGYFDVMLDWLRQRAK